MKKFPVLLISALVLITACTSEQKPINAKKPDEIITDTTIVSGMVVSVDYNSRMVNIKDKTGAYTTFRVDREVKNLDRIQKGDQAVATYIESIGIRVVEPDKADSGIGKKGEATIDIGLKGDKPYLIRARIVEFKAVVDSISHRKRRVVLRGRKGNILSFKVGMNIEGLDYVKKGDVVIIYYTEAIAILLEKTNQGR